MPTYKAKLSSRGLGSKDKFVIVKDNYLDDGIGETSDRFDLHASNRQSKQPNKEPSSSDGPAFEEGWPEELEKEDGDFYKSSSHLMYDGIGAKVQSTRVKRQVKEVTRSL